MRKLHDRPTMSRKKFTVSYPGEIEPEVRQRLARLKMTPQQHFGKRQAERLLTTRP